jgi:septal ring factor EnvC (AmiA/AmiB activator)
MKKVILVMIVLALMFGCTRYASQEQLDELNTMEEAVEALEAQVKDAQMEKSDLMDKIEMKEEELMDCEEEISEIEKKIM